MKFLLDTHVIVWLAVDPARIGVPVADRLRSPDTELLLSVASWWELAIKESLGRLDGVISPAKLREEWLRRENVIEVAIRAEHAFDAAALPLVHKDPFDRILVAQARTENATLVTVDAALAAYGVALLSAAP